MVDKFLLKCFIFFNIRKEKRCKFKIIGRCVFIVRFCRELMLKFIIKVKVVVFLLMGR